MYNRLLTAALLLTTAPAHATGVCLVCPTGYDCAAGSPIGKTGNDKLATIGDITWSNVTYKPETFEPATHSHPEYVPTTRTVAGHALSGNITTAQLRAAMCPPPATLTNVNVIAHHRCAGSTTSPSDMGGFSFANYPNLPFSGGKYCWCRLESKANPGCFSSWVYRNLDTGEDPEICYRYCPTSCANSTAERNKVTW